MCHGHPHYHTCHHTSVKWLYCPEAMFDLETGYETPCSATIYSTPQLASNECPLHNCQLKQLKGDSWACCRCGHNANKEGWCVGKINHPFGSWTPRGLEPQNWQTCGHGYCSMCNRDLSSYRAGTPTKQASEQRKGKNGRKRGSGAALTKEKHEWLHVKSELDESLRKANHKSHELSSKIEELTKSYEKKVQEAHKLKQTFSKVEYEKDELHHTLEELKRKADERQSKWEDAEDRCSKWKIKWDQSERELASVREEIRHFEVEKTELRETMSKKVEELRITIVEKDRINSDFHTERKKSEEHTRKISLLQETIRRHEAIIKERTESIRGFHQRVECIEAERDGARSKCGDLTIEIEQLQASITSLKDEITAVNEKHDAVYEKLRESEARYEEVCVTMSEYTEGHGDFEYEISTLRTMLREAREQKEKAIEARNSADHERDDAIARYEEQMSEQMRAQAKSSSSGGRTVRRFFSRSSTSNEILNGSSKQISGIEV
ncbi:HOOK domain containing protein [Apiospora arundinis]|uniref:HOOK domain containing protein n=1 Tax=Apiospora arundinis TaxID=335852 RepID=A0ABR2IX58_9PEZI